MQYFRLFLLLIGLMLPLQGSAESNQISPIKAQLIQEEKSIQPGRPFWVALQLNIEDGWHVYWKNPGDAGIPLQIDWQLPSGIHVNSLKWPFPEKFSVEDMVGFGYEKEVTLLAELTSDQTLKSGTELNLKGKVKWLVCSALTCQPGETPVNLAVKIESFNPQINEMAIHLFSEARSKLPTSHAIVKTIRKEGIVQLQVPLFESLKEQEEVIGAYFFPEQQDMIDHSVDPTVTVDDENVDQKYVVNLRDMDEIGAKASQLKGVLVVHKQKDAKKQIEAFDIDSLIQESHEQEFLSFLDPVPNKIKGKLSHLANTTSSLVPSKSHFEGGLGLALVFAFLGGMILNLMPCVLPVMSFKVMSFVKMAGQSRALTIKHGLMFAAGVVLSFWALAGAMLLLRAYGQSVGWGFQLQEPLFVIILASILFIFSLSLFGLFEWGMFLASWAGQTQAEAAQKTSGYGGSFLSGVLATAVATPCTGPFLGSAVGFAVTLPIPQALLIFTVLALGMCLPYLLLAIFPSFLRFIPKPGPWMETFKQLMGFGLLATVLWLMWVFSAQTNTLSLICVLGGFLCFSIGAWLYGKGSSPLVKKPKRLFTYAFVALFFVAGCQAILLPKQSWYQESAADKKVALEKDWEPFSIERITDLQEQGQPILIDFTAKWCLICQANHLVLSTDEVADKLTEMGIVKMKADWTKNDPAITEALSKFGRTSVPLYVLYGTEGKEPIILPQVLTPDGVVEQLQKAIDSEHIVLQE